MKDEKKNPFGSSISTYSPDIDELSLSEKKYNKEKTYKSLMYKGILLFFIIVALLVIANGFYVADKKDEALGSIDNTNKQMLNVQSVAINDNAEKPYKDILDNDKSSREDKESAKFVTNAIKYIRTNDISILNQDMTDEQTAKSIAPYAVACDYSRKLDKDDELDNACEKLNDATDDMIFNIKVFNKLITSFNGAVSWTDRTPLPEPFK